MNATEIMLELGLAEPNGVSFEQIESYQHKLYDANRALIPLGYSRFLQQVNGVQTDTLALFGIQDRQQEEVRDIFEVNTMAGTEQQTDQIFLGDNFKEYLSYDWKEKSYIVISKQSSQIEKRFPFFDYAMVYFLRDYIEKS